MGATTAHLIVGSESGALRYGSRATVLGVSTNGWHAIGRAAATEWTLRYARCG